MHLNPLTTRSSQVSLDQRIAPYHTRSCFVPAKRWLAEHRGTICCRIIPVPCSLPLSPLSLRDLSCSSACSIYTFSRDGFSMSHPLPSLPPPPPHSLKFDLPLLRWHSQPGRIGSLARVRLFADAARAILWRLATWFRTLAISFAFDYWSVK